jgi:single-stranded DNA-binding protein
MAINKVLLEGNLVTDPQIKEFPSGKMKSTLKLAISYINHETKESTPPLFLYVTLWNDLAKNFNGKKGDLVTLEGKLVDDSFLKDGVKQPRLGIVASKAEVRTNIKKDTKAPEEVK